MDCKDTRKRMTPYVDAELSDVEREAIDEHLEACSPCARRVTFEQNFNRILREGLVEKEVPSGVLARVRRGIAWEARAESRGVGRWLFHPVTAYATAAALMLALMLPAVIGGAPGFAGWRAVFHATSALHGMLVCIECDRAHMTPEQQRMCRQFNHHTGIHGADGKYWAIVDRGAGAELNARPELRGAVVRVDGESFPTIGTFDVRSYELI